MLKMMPQRGAGAGFTLIEMLIVMVIIGFSISVISLSIGKSSETDVARSEAQQLLQALDFVGEQAVLNGELIAMFVTTRPTEDGLNKRWCYSWQRWRDRHWSALPEETLTEHCLPEAVQWDIVIEGKPYIYDPDIKPPKPVLSFAPSGETNALDMAIFERGSDSPAQRIEIDLMGNLHWRNQEEEERRNGR